MANQVNPNWPLLTVNGDFTQGPPHVPGVNQLSLNAQSRRTTVRTIQTTHGRQYELDQVQAGTATLEILDPLENLHPANTASPFNTSGNSITSYRCVQVGAYWNTASNNLSGNMLATGNPIPGQPWLGGQGAAAPYGYDPSFENWFVHQQNAPSGLSLVSGLPTGALNSNPGFETGTSPWTPVGCTVAQSSTQKHSGSFSAKITPDGVSSASQLFSEALAIVPGRQYTATAWMWATASVTSAAEIAVTWYDNASNFLSFTTTTAVSLPATTWTQLTGTVTAPAGAALAQITPQVGGTPPVGNIFYFDDVSLTNFVPPADSTYPVWAMTFQAYGEAGGWRPRYIPGQGYSVQVDVWAAAGFPVQLAWNGSGGAATTSITGNGAYQTMTISFTPTATDVINGLQWTLTPASGAWATYPETIYLSKIITQGTPAGWSTTGSALLSYTPVVPFTGNYSQAFAMSSGTDTASLPLATAPGYQYTFSAYVLVQTTGATATQLVLGANTSTTAVGSWQRLTQTFTATDAVTTVTWSASSGSYPAIFYLDAIQLELGSSASTFSTSGPTFFPLYTGYIERFPLQWDMNGTRGIRPLACVDALAVLSRTEVTQSYSATILADSPSAFAPLNDAALPQQVQLPQGGFTMSGYTSIGTNGQVGWQGDRLPDGSPAVTVTQQNADPATSGNTAYITYVGTSNGGIFFNPEAFSIEFWVKFTSGTVYLGAGSVTPTENTNTEALGPNQYIGIYTSAGKAFGHYADNNGSSFAFGFPGWSGYPDGQWHYVAIVLPGSNDVHLFCDGIAGGYGSFTGTPIQLSLNNLFIDATTYFGDPSSVVAVANMATYNSALTDTQLQNHYQRGVGYIKEVSGTRVLRLLQKYWSSAVVVGAGSRAMAEDYSYNARFLLDILQEIQETERGQIYADRYGTVTFDDSTSRYVNYPASVATFGENPTGASPAEYPYQDLVEDFDPTYTFTQTNLTRPDNTSFPPLPNPLPTNPPYGQRILTQEVQVTTDFDLYQASAFYLQRYATPVLRVETLTLNLAANPALFSSVLGLEFGSRITVKRRTSAGLITSNDYYVEQIRHSINAETSAWTVELQCSPVFNSNAWILGDPVYGVLGSTTIPIY